MKLYIFRNEPGTGYNFCTKQPEPIYRDNMRSVVYTNYGELLGCIPTLTFERLFPKLRFEGGAYRIVSVECGVNNIEGTAYYKILGRTR